MEILNKEIMLLTVSKKSMTYSKDAIKYGMVMETIFKRKSVVSRVCSRVDRKFSTEFSTEFFNSDWTKKLPYIKKLIIVANVDTASVVKYVNKKFPNIKIHVWYNNPVKNEISPTVFKKLNCSLWTFDKNDSREFGMKYNAQYIDVVNFINISPNLPSSWDIVFIGASKDRLNIIRNFEEKVKELGISFHPYVIKSKNESLENYNFQKKKLSYAAVLSMESRGRAILEILQSGQSGLSLRPLEAIFLEKKIITNNAEIENEPFYSSENVFILGKDDFSNLNTFLNAPVSLIDHKIREYYTFSSWVSRFN